jgi:Na+-transporting NADH:ubiquinone oxidoreductase subunit D
MGRAEAYALRNPPMMAVVDGVANGLGYAAVLVIIGFFRELIGSGKLLDIVVLSDNWYIPNQMMILAPGAFLALGFLIALANYIKPRQEEETK